MGAKQVQAAGRSTPAGPGPGLACCCQATCRHSPQPCVGAPIAAASRSPCVKCQCTNGSDRSQTHPLCSGVGSSCYRASPRARLVQADSACPGSTPLLHHSPSLHSTVLVYRRCQTETFHVNFLQPTYSTVCFAPIWYLLPCQTCIYLLTFLLN